jgi:hypothetical protein
VEMANILGVDLKLDEETADKSVNPKLVKFKKETIG